MNAKTPRRQEEKEIKKTEAVKAFVF